jgi:hypothetical protein
MQHPLRSVLAPLAGLAFLMFLPAETSLPGYKENALRVRFKLIPDAWCYGLGRHFRMRMI